MRTWRGSASGSWHQVSEGKEEWCCDGNDRWTSVLHRWSLDTWPPSAAWAGTARPQPDHQQQQPTTVWRPLHWSTCVRQHLQLRTGGFCSCTSAFGLGRRCWSSPQQCYLHRLRAWSATSCRLQAKITQWHYSMWSRVYASVGRLFVRLSVWCLSVSAWALSSKATAAGLQPSARQAENIDRLLHGVCVVSECGKCHFVSICSSWTQTC